jgi:hypothetical protein
MMPAFSSRMISHSIILQRVVWLHERWCPHYSIVEDRGSGSSLVQDVRYQAQQKRLPLRFKIFEIQPDSDKVMRMQEVSPTIQKSPFSPSFERNKLSTSFRGPHIGVGL